MCQQQVCVGTWHEGREERAGSFAGQGKLTSCVSVMVCVCVCLCREGNLIWPVLLDNVTPEMRIAWEEPFGPVVPVMRVSSVEAAVQHCNSSNFGLQGCVFTRDINAAMRISDAMRTGTVQVCVRLCIGWGRGKGGVRGSVACLEVGGDAWADRSCSCVKRRTQVRSGKRDQ